MNRSSGFWRASQPCTAGSGTGFISSDSTLVSRTIIAALFEHWRLADGLTRERLQLDAAQRLNDGPDRLGEVARRCGRWPGAKGLLQNSSRLGFHRSAVHGGALLEPLLQVVVDVTDRDAGHRLSPLCHRWQCR